MCLKSNEHQSIGIDGAKYQQKWGIMFHLCFCTGIVFVVSILAFDSFYSFYYSWLKLSGNGSTQTQVTLPSCPGSSSNHAGCCFLSAGSKLQCFISKWNVLDIHNWWRCYAIVTARIEPVEGLTVHGWMQVAMLDMRDRSSCPRGLRERVHPKQRLRGKALILVALQISCPMHADIYIIMISSAENNYTYQSVR